MTFKDAIKKLGIEDYGMRIYNSNSHGELFHLLDYIRIAELLDGDLSWFRPVFEQIVEFAEENWGRPESVFQHILNILIQMKPLEGG